MAAIMLAFRRFRAQYLAPHEVRMTALESSESLERATRAIRDKPALRAFYHEAYAKFAGCVARCPPGGGVLELGSGGGFLREVLPDVVTSDVLPYPGVDNVVDATRMQFADASLRAILMLNVFHHIADCAAFLREAARCLVPGGRVFMVDQYPGWLSTPIFRYVHHEGFAPDAASWTFASSGPLSSANGALAWIVFERDRARFDREFPELELARFAPHTPLLYWLSGGLKSWSLIPGFGVAPAARLDRALARLSPGACSFVDIELVRRGPAR
jgi:SAM-dependent methyltransferase